MRWKLVRVCIDATALLLRSAGVKNYIYHWLCALQSDAPDLDVSAFPLLGKFGNLDHERSVLSLAQTLPRIALLHFVNIRFNPGINYVIRGADVFHASNLLQNLPTRALLTGTIFDMTARLFPQFHTKGNTDAESSYHQRVLKRAAGLIAISQSAKDDAVRILGLEPDRIWVVHPGIDPRFFAVRRDPSAKPYFLFLGTIEPRKNIDTLLDAWLAVSPEVRREFKLRIAGPIGWAAGVTVARLRSGLEGVEVVGYVSEVDLPALVANARGFVYPSFYEGFGLPLAQAMAAGVPSITSNISSLPEVAGDAAILVEPRSVEQLKSAIERLALSPSLQQELGERGRKRALRFTWKNSAAHSAEFFLNLR